MDKNKQKKIWITWENQRRNQSLSKELNAELYQIVIAKEKPLKRYLFSLFRTIRIYYEEKPRVLFVQNPSIVLAFLAVLIGKISNTKIIVDAHNAGVFPYQGRKWWMNQLTYYLLKNADITIVTNQNLANYILKRKGRPFVLPDPIPNFVEYFSKNKLNLKGKYNIFFICTFARDEPYLEVIKAADLIGKDICIYISGNYTNRVQKNEMPANVILTDYLPEHEYLGFLHSSDLVMDLTTLQDCLVCGAYEAIAAEKPVILSDTAALKEYFYKGSLFTDNNSRDIAEQITKGIDNMICLKKEAAELKIELISNWNEKKELFEKLINKQ